MVALTAPPCGHHSTFSATSLISALCWVNLYHVTELPQVFLSLAILCRTLRLSWGSLGNCQRGSFYGRLCYCTVNSWRVELQIQPKEGAIGERTNDKTLFLHLPHSATLSLYFFLFHFLLFLSRSLPHPSHGLSVQYLCCRSFKMNWWHLLPVSFPPSFSPLSVYPYPSSPLPFSFFSLAASPSLSNLSSRTLNLPSLLLSCSLTLSLSLSCLCLALRLCLLFDYASGVALCEKFCFLCVYARGL